MQRVCRWMLEEPLTSTPPIRYGLSPHNSHHLPPADSLPTLHLSKTPHTLPAAEAELPASPPSSAPMASGRSVVIQHTVLHLHILCLQELVQRQAQCQPVAEETGCPAEVDSYHSLCPLEPVAGPAQEQVVRHLFGHPSTCYRVTSSKDGLFYCLRRLHGEPQRHLC